MHFLKYQGTGNDFIMVDSLSAIASVEATPEFTASTIRAICDRRKGVGSDGVIVIKPHAQYDFEMVYYNADGHEGTMCGNGGRCAVAYAKHLGIIQNDKSCFMACDGLHFATIDKRNDVTLKMSDVKSITSHAKLFRGTMQPEAGDILQQTRSTAASDKIGHYFLDTGSPHHVCFVKDLDSFDVEKYGSMIRNHPHYKSINGSNVNFVTFNCDFPNELRVRTFERGVEHETFACGTGAVASAIVAAHIGFPPPSIEDTNIDSSESNCFITEDDADYDKYINEPAQPINRAVQETTCTRKQLVPNDIRTNTWIVHTKGGTLIVTWNKNSDKQLYSEIYLKGPAVKVFEGEYVI